MMFRQTRERRGLQAEAEQITHQCQGRRGRLVASYLVALVSLAVLSGCGEAGQGPEQGSPQASAQDMHDAHASATGAGEDMHHEHAGETHAAPVLPEGERWPTDLPLRTAMERIRTAVEANEAAYSSGTLAQGDAAELAAQVESNVQYMIANCKLPPEPDAALHVLIGRMMSASSALKADPAAENGLPQLVSVLRDYEATFDHTGDQPGPG